MKRTSNGVIIHKGRQVDMYLLRNWLVAYNNQTGAHYTFATITTAVLKKFIESTPRWKL
jgi:hypothetical protein